MIEGKSPECIQKTVVASLATDQNTASKESIEVRTYTESMFCEIFGLLSKQPATNAVRKDYLLAMSNLLFSTALTFWVLLQL